MIKVSKTSKAGARSAVPTGQAWRHQIFELPEPTCSAYIPRSKIFTGIPPTW